MTQRSFQTDEDVKRAWAYGFVWGVAAGMVLFVALFEIGISIIDPLY